MHNDKAKILNRLCYTELVYERINKKLHCQLSKNEIEKLIFKVINETREQFFERKGKNIYVTNREENIKITINANTYRVITVDRIIKVVNNTF
jgi:hypothetical protein